MYCINCGKELPGDARFCLQCGKPQGATSDNESAATTRDAELTWEICDVVYIVIPRGCLASRLGKFQAKVIKPTGVEFIGTSPSFVMAGDTPSPNETTRAALDALVAELLRSSWEPTGLSDNVWFKQRFRRRASYDPQSPEEQARRQLESEAYTLYTYLQSNGVRLKETAQGDLVVKKGPRLTRETQATVRRLTPQLREFVIRDRDV